VRTCLITIGRLTVGRAAYERLKLIDEKVKQPPKQNSYIDENIYIDSSERGSKAEYSLFHQ
jgi:hypothetical protein